MTKEDDLTLSVTRTIDAPRDVVWRCWTEGALLKQWYCPKPWTVPEADIDARAGGRMNTVMAGPNGERMENKGCFLEVREKERLVFTGAFEEDFVPTTNTFMTGVVELSDAPGGKTHMVWSARHPTAADRDKHLEMGFAPGWNAAADQLEALAESVAANEGA